MVLEKEIKKLLIGRVKNKCEIHKFYMFVIGASFLVLLNLKLELRRPGDIGIEELRYLEAVVYTLGYEVLYS